MAVHVRALSDCGTATLGILEGAAIPLVVHGPVILPLHMLHALWSCCTTNMRAGSGIMLATTVAENSCGREHMYRIVVMLQQYQC